MQITMVSMPLLGALTRLEVATSDVDFPGLLAIGQLTALRRLSLADCQVPNARGYRSPGDEEFSCLKSILMVSSHRLRVCTVVWGIGLAVYIESFSKEGWDLTQSRP